MSSAPELVARVLLAAYRSRQAHAAAVVPELAEAAPGPWQSAGRELTADELAGINRGALELRAWVDVDDALELWPLAGLDELEHALDDIDRAPDRAALVRFDARRRRHG